MGNNSVIHLTRTNNRLTESSRIFRNLLLCLIWLSLKLELRLPRSDLLSLTPLICCYVATSIFLIVLSVIRSVCPSWNLYFLSLVSSFSPPKKQGKSLGFISILWLMYLFFVMAALFYMLQDLTVVLSTLLPVVCINNDSQDSSDFSVGLKVR